MSEFEKPKPPTEELISEKRYTKENPLVRDPFEDALPIVSYGEERQNKGFCVSEYTDEDVKTGENYGVYRLIVKDGDEMSEVTVVKGEVQFEEGAVVNIPRGDGSAQDGQVEGFMVYEGQPYTKVVFNDYANGGRLSEKAVLTKNLRELNEPEPVEETEIAMNERFIRERQVELRDLYAAHRAEPAGTDEQYRLERDINSAKEDIGKYMVRLRELKRSK